MKNRRRPHFSFLLFLLNQTHHLADIVKICVFFSVHVAVSSKNNSNSLSRSPEFRK